MITFAFEKHNVHISCTSSFTLIYRLLVCAWLSSHVSYILYYSYICVWRFFLCVVLFTVSVPQMYDAFKCCWITCTSGCVISKW